MFQLKQLRILFITIIFLLDQSGIMAKLNFVNQSSTITLSDTPNTQIKFNQTSSIKGWSESSITRENGHNAPSNWNPVISPGTIIGPGGVTPPLPLVIANSNAIANFGATSGVLARTTSNALLYLNRVNSNAINATSQLAKGTSNALLYLNRVNSNAINATSQLAKGTSNALLYLNRVNSNAINATSQLTKATSNSLIYLNRVNSNAINSLSLGGSTLARTTSNALLYLNRVNSNAINATSRLARSNSNALLYNARITSNALVTGLSSNSSSSNNAIKAVSNALLYLNRIASNAINAQNTRLNNVETLAVNLNTQIRLNSNAFIYNQRITSNAIVAQNTRLSNVEVLSVQNTNNIRLNSNAFAYNARITSNAVNRLKKLLDILVPGQDAATADAIPSENPDGSIPNTLIGAASKGWSSVGFPLRTVAWSDDGQYLAAGGQLPDIGNGDTDITAEHELKIYKYNTSLKTLTGFSSKDWSSIGNSIRAMAWNTGSATGDIFLAVGGNNPNMSEEDAKYVTASDALRIYKFVPNASLAPNRLIGVASKPWSLVGSAIHSLSWAQDDLSGRIFLAVGGENPSTGAETNIDPQHQLRLYEINPSALVPENILVGTTSKGWSTTGSPIKTLEWFQEPTSKRLFLALGGTTPNTGSETNINAAHGLRIYELVVGTSVSLVGVASVGWSTFGAPINSLSWSQDKTTKRIFLGVGGENPNSPIGSTTLMPTHEFRLYEFIPGTAAQGAATLTGLTTKNWSSIGLPINAVSWSADGQFIALGGGYPNVKSPEFTRDIDDNINASHEIRVYDFDVANNELVGLGSKNWSTIGNPVYSLAWHPREFSFAIGGARPNTTGGDPTKIGETDQLRVYTIPDSLTGGAALLRSSVAKKKTIKKQIGYPSVSTAVNAATIVSATVATSAAAATKTEAAAKAEATQTVAAATQAAGAQKAETKSLSAEEKIVANEIKKKEDKITKEKTIKVLGSRKISKAESILFGLASKPWTVGEDIINSCSWSPDGAFIAVAGSGANINESDTAINPQHILRIYQYDVIQQKLIGVTSSACNEYSTSIASTSWFKTEQEYLLAVVCNSRDKNITGDKKDLLIYSFDPQTKKLTEKAWRSWTTKTGELYAVAWHPNKSYLALAGGSPNTDNNDTNIDKGHELRLYFYDGTKTNAKERLTGIVSKPWSLKNQSIKTISWNHLGTMLAVGGEEASNLDGKDSNFKVNEEIRLYSFDAESPDKLTSFASIGWPEQATCIIETFAWSPDDRYLVAAGKCAEAIKSISKSSAMQELKIYQITQNDTLQKRVTQIAGKGWSTRGTQILTACWSNDGKYLIVGGEEPDLRDEDFFIKAQDQLRLYYFNPQHKEYGERLIGITSKAWSTKGLPITATAWNPVKDTLLVCGKQPDQDGNDPLTIKKNSEIRLYNLVATPQEKNKKKTKDYDAKTIVGVTSKQWATQGASIKKTAWSNDGKFVAVGGILANSTDDKERIQKNHRLRIYQLTSSDIIGVTSKAWSNANNSINALAWSPKDNYLAVGGTANDSPPLNSGIKPDNDLYIYSFSGSTDTISERLKEFAYTKVATSGGQINDIAWSPDGEYLVVVGYFPLPAKPGSEPESSQEIRTYKFNPSGGAQERLSPLSITTIKESVNSISWSKYDNFVALGCQNSLQVYKFSKGYLSKLGQLEGNDVPSKINGISWSPNNKFLAAGGDSSTEKKPKRNGLFIYQFNAEGGSIKPIARKIWASYGDAVNGVSWNADGDFVAVGGVNQTEIEGDNKEQNALQLYYFDPQSNTLTSIDNKPWSKVGGRITSLEWSPNGEHLIVAGMGSNTNGNDAMVHPTHELRLYRLKKTIASTFTSITSKDWSTSDNQINAINWSPNGKFLAVGGLRADIKESQEPIKETDPFRIYEFNENNSVLQAIVSYPFNNTKELESEVTALAWHPNNELLAVAERKLSNKVSMSSNVTILKFDAKLKTISSVMSKAFGGTANTIIKALDWSADGQLLALGGKYANAHDPKFQDKDTLRIYRFKQDTNELTGETSIGYGNEASIDTLEWMEDEGDLFLAIGANHINRETAANTSHQKTSSQQNTVPTEDNGNDTAGSNDKNACLKVYRYNDAKLAQIFNKEWSSHDTSEIKSVAWSPNKSFLAVGGGKSDSVTDQIPAQQALHIYFFDNHKSQFSGILSKAWSNNGGMIRQISWAPNNLFLGVGGDSPNVVDRRKDKNINPYNEFRLYFFDGFNLEGIISREWSTLGYPLLQLAWHTSGKFLAFAGARPTHFDSTPNSNELQIYRFNEGTAIPHTLQDAIQKANSTTSMIITRGNGEFWSIDRGSLFFFNGLQWEAARVDGSIKNPGHGFVSRGPADTFVALDDKGNVHRSTLVSTGPAITVWQPLTPVGIKAPLSSIIYLNETLFGISDDKKYYQFDEKRGWKMINGMPEAIENAIKKQFVSSNYITIGSISRKKGTFDDFILPT